MYLKEVKSRVTVNPSVGRSKDVPSKKKPLEARVSLSSKDEKAKKIKKESSEKSVEKRAVLQHQPSVVRDAVKPKPKVAPGKPAQLKNVPHKSLSTTVRKPANPKATAKAGPSSSSRKAPLRATHSIDVKSTVKPTNVMNRVHNVTVSSPPPVRRELGEPPSVETVAEPPAVESSAARDRTRTRTLGESEIVLLKPRPAAESSACPPPQPVESVSVEIKPAITFEVHFGDDKRVDTKASQVAGRGDEKEELAGDGEEQDEYDDDFESYESDFEVDISSNASDESGTESKSSGASSDDSSSRGGSSPSSDDSNVVKSATKHPFRIRNSASADFDSGSFEMKPLPDKGHDDDNYPAISAADHQKEMQNDSGFDNNSATLNPSAALTLNSLEINNKTCDNISDIEAEVNVSAVAAKSDKRSKFDARGSELLDKIVLDTMNFLLYDAQPISYDLFMKMYGGNASTQVAVQTHLDHVHQECQCEPVEATNSWTQMPPTFYKRQMRQPNFGSYRVGSETEACSERTESELSGSWQMLQRFMAPRDGNRLVDEPSADFDALNQFLLAKEVTVTRLLSGRDEQAYGWTAAQLDQSEKCLEISLDAFAFLAPFKLYELLATNALPGFVFTVHVDSEQSLHLIVLWSLTDARRPFCLLSCWTRVTCIEVHEDNRNIIFGGLSDG